MILVASFNKAAVLAEVADRARQIRRDPGSAHARSIRRRHLGGLPAKKFVVQIESDDLFGLEQAVGSRLQGQGGNCVVLQNSLR